MKTETVFQDGGQFYAWRPDSSYTCIADFGRVRDYDISAAERVRKHFIKVWCPANGIEPVFETEDLGDIFQE